MCFSAGASFGASAVILVISAAAFNKATNPAQRVIAAVPLFFGIQQGIEGFLWLSLQDAAYSALYAGCTYGFLMLALVVWPAMIPLMAMLPEGEERRRRVMRLLFSTGVLVSLFHLYGLAMYGAVATAQQHHIRYELHFPKAMLAISGIVYFIPALIPPFMSSHKPIRWLGLVLVLSYGMARFFFQPYIISVWCYFATAISIVALLAIIQMNREKDLRPQRHS